MVVRWIIDVDLHSGAQTVVKRQEVPGGFEVIRAIAFIVRDTCWGTYSPAIGDLVIEESADRFVVDYEDTILRHGSVGLLYRQF
jgi:hypothetical protein